MENQKILEEQVIAICLLAGKLMLESGGETYRVEDTMSRIASAYGINNSQSYVTPTGIMFSIDETKPAHIVRIVNRTVDLYKVTLVNSISRKISDQLLTYEEAYNRLKKITTEDFTFPIMQQVAAAGIASACFMLMFLGSWYDFFPALVSGAVGFYSFVYIHQLVKIKFFAEFFASIIISIIAVVLVKSGIGMQVDKIIIGSVMPLVPGLLLTNAIRDLMAGHLVASLSKGADAFLTAFSIGAGVAVVLAFL